MALVQADSTVTVLVVAELSILTLLSDVFVFLLNDNVMF